MRRLIRAIDYKWAFLQAQNYAGSKNRGVFITADLIPYIWHYIHLDSVVISNVHKI